MKTTHRTSSSGFTLIELLVTIAIIAILISIVTGVASVAQRKSAESQARANLQTLANALEEWRIEYGRYPEELSDLDGMLEDGEEPLPPTDPWGRAFEYATPDNRLTYTLYSRGLRAGDDETDDDLDVSRDAF